METALRNFVAKLVKVDQRLLSLERRFRELSGRMVRNFVQLDDARTRIEEHDPLTPGDAWGINVDGEWDIITPAGGGGGGGSLTTASIWGSYGLVPDDFIETDWIEGTTDWQLISGGGTIGGLAPKVPGFYAVHAQVLYGTGTVSIRTTDPTPGWRYANEDACRFYPISDDDSSASVLMPCVDQGGEFATGVHLIFDATGEIGWRLQVHLVRPADLASGNCGG